MKNIEKAQLERFRIQQDELKYFLDTFSKLLVNANVNTLDRTMLGRKLPEGTSGCYFWVMQFEGSLYKIYIGRTKSVLKRTTDYINDFQIHAPNDYKLRFFQTYMEKNIPAAALDLYFTPVHCDLFQEKENELVRLYGPLINERMPPTENDRVLIRKAFESYYEATFNRKLIGEN